MLAFVTAADLSHANNMRSQLAQRGLECPRLAAKSISQLQADLQAEGIAPDVIFLLLPENSRAACDAIKNLRHLTTAPLIALGEGGNVDDVLNLVRAGASDYVLTNDHLADELNATLRRIRASRGNPVGKLWGIASTSGGSGGSMLATNVAVELAKLSSACLFDLHWQGGDCAALLDLHPPHTLSDLCSQGQQLDVSMFQQALAEHGSGLRLLASTNTIQSPERPDNLEIIIHFAQTSFRHVLLDFDSFLNPLHTTAVDLCDRLLLVFRPEFPSVLRTRWILQTLQERSIALDRIVLVANRVGQQGELPIRKAAEVLGMSVNHSIPDDVSHVLAALNLGNPVVLEYPACKSAKAIRRLAAELTNLETPQ